LKKIDEGKKITDEELTSLTSSLGDVTDLFVLTAEGWKFIGNSMNQLTAAPLAKLTEARA